MIKMKGFSLFIMESLTIIPKSNTNICPMWHSEAKLTLKLSHNWWENLKTKDIPLSSLSKSWKLTSIKIPNGVLYWLTSKIQAKSTLPHDNSQSWLDFHQQKTKFTLLHKKSPSKTTLTAFSKLKTMKYGSCQLRRSERQRRNFCNKEDWTWSTTTHRSWKNPQNLTRDFTSMRSDNREK